MVTPQPTGFVTFSDEAKGEIKGIEKIVGNDLPRLDNVLLVKGLTANLISISQLCDLWLKVNFTKEGCYVIDSKDEVIMKGERSKDNCYLWTPLEPKVLSTCLVNKQEDVRLWHQKLGHLHLRGMKKILSKEAIKGVPQLTIEEGTFCGECQIGKQVKTSHPKLQHLTTDRVLELLHMDLMGPMQVENNGGKSYAFVIVDDFSRYTWIEFIREKSETFGVFREICLRVQNEKDTSVMRIRSDHGREFENALFSEFCASRGIKHEFSSPITPQQNGIAERKNRTIQESARVMLHAKQMPYHFWAEAMSTACYIHNRVTIRKGTSCTLYEVWRGKKPNVSYFHIFGSKCYILLDRDPRRKLDPKGEEGIFLGYSTNSRAYRVYNNRTKVIIESINVVVDDAPVSMTHDVADAAPPVPQASFEFEETEGQHDESNDEVTEVQRPTTIEVLQSESRRIILQMPSLVN
jgi:hypothetical protein